jgi:hypothetical protein
MPKAHATPERRDELLRAEAGGLLEHSRDVLTDFGEVGVIGSYALNLMTRRDLNIMLCPQERLDRAVAFEVGSRLATRLTPSSMQYRDELCGRSVRFPRGIGWDIRVEWRPHRTWRLDVWLVEFDAFQAAGQHTSELLIRLSPTARQTILTLKHRLSSHPKYGERFVSGDIYDAVLDHGISTLTALRRCLRRRGVRL